ncbi:MAG: hypothetical protein RLZZ426_879 [Actinomycetota bacterium]
MKPNWLTRKLIISIALLSLSCVTVVTSPSIASEPCAGTITNRFAGASTSTYSQSIFGARALITRNIPAICTSSVGSFGASLIWTMVTAKSIDYPNTLEANGWAQSGYANIGYQFGESVSGIFTFSQWTKSCKSNLNCVGAEVVTMYTPAPSASANYYSTFRRASSGRIEMWGNGLKITEMAYNTQGTWQAQWQAQYYAETFFQGDDAAGTSSNKASLTNIQYYDSNGNLEFAALGPIFVSSNSPRNHATKWNPTSGGTGLKIWTDPLN